MLIKCLPVGQLEANCYIVTNEETGCCVVIDPGDEANTILDYIEDNKLRVDAIFLTHGHFDHTRAAREVAFETGAKTWIHRSDVAAEGKKELYRFSADENTMYYDDDEYITKAGMEFHVIHTPGHSAGSVILVCGDVIFTGDTLFRKSCGRTDLAGGDIGVLMTSLKKIWALDGDYEIYPGHLDASTLSFEREFNYYLRYANGQE